MSETNGKIKLCECGTAPDIRIDATQKRRVFWLACDNGDCRHGPHGYSTEAKAVSAWNAPTALDALRAKADADRLLLWGIVRGSVYKKEYGLPVREVIWWISEGEHGRILDSSPDGIPILDDAAIATLEAARAAEVPAVQPKAKPRRRDPDTIIETPPLSDEFQQTKHELGI